MFNSRLIAFAVGALLCSFGQQASAQACCAGVNAITPARLGLHEDALVGASFRLQNVYGNYDASGNYQRALSGTSEQDLQEAVVVAARVSSRVQVALLAPIVQTIRRTRQAVESGGGLGDLNFSTRYDILRAHESRFVPGFGFLAGLTVPTGRAAEAARMPLATDATGTGAAQVVVGLALEQSYGPWLLGSTGVLAWRSSRTAQEIRLSSPLQMTLRVAASYAFKNGVGLGAAASYAAEGNRSVNGQLVPQSSNRLLNGMLSGVIPFGERWRGTAMFSMSPPLSGISRNQPANMGTTIGIIWSYP